MALLGVKNAINYRLKETHFSCNRAQLIEMLRILARFPIGTRVEVGGGRHATALKIVASAQGIYFDPNFDSDLRRTHDPESLADLIIKTKYNSLQPRSNMWLESPVNNIERSFSVCFSAFYFAWEKNVSDSFNYFAEGELPTSQADAEAFVAASPNGFNNIHIAILTKSKENLKKLIDDGYCDVNLKTKDYPWATPLKMAYDSGDMELCDIVLRHKDIQLVNPSLLLEAYRQGNNEFVDKVVNHPNSTCLHELFIAAAQKNDLEMLEKLFSNNKIERITTLSSIAKNILNDIKISEEVKNLVYQNYKDIRDERGNGLIHHIISGQDEALEFVLKCDSSVLSSKNNASQTALQLFCSEAINIAKIGADCSFGKVALIFIEYLPDKIDIYTGWMLLDLLHSYAEPYRAKYVDRVCDAIGNVEQLYGKSIFKITLLEYFVSRNDAVITQALLSRMRENNVNHQHSEKNYTALHHILKITPNTPEEKASRYEIINLLVKRGADLDLADADGESCRQIIERIADPEITSILSTKAAISF